MPDGAQSGRSATIEREAAPAGERRLAPLQQQAAPLRNKIIGALRSAVELGILRPGQRLVEKDLCEQLSVSRTSLREALRELQAEGLLQEAGARGLCVSLISREDAENSYRLRGAIESLVVEQFTERASETEIRQLIDESEELKKVYRAGDLQAMLDRKRAFYDRICSGARNPMARDMIARLVLRTSSVRVRSLRRQERQAQSVEEITRLVDAVARRDAEAARRAAEEHVANAARFSLAGWDAEDARLQPRQPAAGL